MAGSRQKGTKMTKNWQKMAGTMVESREKRGKRKTRNIEKSRSKKQGNT